MISMRCICRDFIETILIKEDFDDPKERARRAAAKRKQKEEEAAKAKQNRMVDNIKYGNWNKNVILDKHIYWRWHKTSCETIQDGFSCRKNE